MGRRRNAISSEDSDDDRPDEASASNPGANPQSASKGKKWTPGMSGKEQKARAKEQRFEQHRRKAERERRNEQKRASREQREEHGAVHAETTTAPSKPVGRPGGNVARLDPSQIRRELKRLFGRIEHGGGVSPSSGRAVEVGDVVVVLIEPEIVAQRKSGAEAWSQRLNKRGEKEFGLSDFLALASRRARLPGGVLVLVVPGRGGRERRLGRTRGERRSHRGWRAAVPHRAPRRRAVGGLAGGDPVGRSPPRPRRRRRRTRVQRAGAGTPRARRREPSRPPDDGGSPTRPGTRRDAVRRRARAHPARVLGEGDARARRSRCVRARRDVRRAGAPRAHSRGAATSTSSCSDGPRRR